MNVTIKTEILVKAWREFSFPHITCVSQLVPNEGEHAFFSLCHDHQRVIISEYEKLLGSLPAFRGWMAELLKHQVLSQRRGAARLDEVKFRPSQRFLWEGFLLKRVSGNSA